MLNFTAPDTQYLVATLIYYSRQISDYAILAQLRARAADVAVAARAV